MSKLTCPTCEIIDCCPPSGLDDYLLVGPTFLNNQVSVLFDCPEGYVCAPGTYPLLITIPRGEIPWNPPPTPTGLPLTIQCCDGPLTVAVPDGITQVAYVALIQSMLDEAARRLAGCKEKGFRSRKKKQTNDAQTINCPGGDDLFNVSGQPLSSFLPPAIRISTDGKGLTIRSGAFSAEGLLKSDAELKAEANATALDYVTAQFNAAISQGKLQCGIVPAPCDLGVADDTVVGVAASVADITVLNSAMPFGTFGPMSFVAEYLNGCFNYDITTGTFACPGLEYTTLGHIIEYQTSLITTSFNLTQTGSDRSNVLDLAGCPAQPADCSYVSGVSPTGQFYHSNGVVQIKFSGWGGYGALTRHNGSPNPRWQLIRKKKPVSTPPARLRVKDFSTVFAPGLVGCSGATNAAGEATWDGTFPGPDFQNNFTGWTWRPDFSLGLKLNGKVISSATKLYHSTAAEPTSTGCAWVMGVDFDFGFGSWVGLGGNGYDPSGTYIFNPAASGWSLCSQKADARAATTAPLPTNSFAANVLTASTNGALPAIDGVTLALNDRVLVKNEAADPNNGIYTATDLGSAGTPWQLTRAVDADTSPEVTQGIFLKITSGAVNGGSYYRLVTLDVITLNTTGLNFLHMPSSVTIESY